MAAGAAVWDGVDRDVAERQCEPPGRHHHPTVVEQHGARQGVRHGLLLRLALAAPLPRLRHTVLSPLAGVRSLRGPGVLLRVRDRLCPPGGGDGEGGGGPGLQLGVVLHAEAVDCVHAHEQQSLGPGHIIMIWCRVKIYCTARHGRSSQIYPVSGVGQFKNHETLIKL